jgi:hypothetical protein
MHHIEPPASEALGRGPRPAWLKAGLVLGWLLLVAATLGPASLLAWLGTSAATLLRTALALGGILLLPGFALLRWLWPTPSLARAERLALATGLGMALPPVLLGAAHLLGLPWSRATTAAYAALALLALLWPAHGQPWRTRLRRPRWALSWHGVVLSGLLGLGLLIRLYVVRDLPVALWGDSYHHTLITQLLLDNRGLFSSWEPYAPLNSFTYHYGFHANSAFVAWLTGMSAAQSVLIVGQLANAATMLMAYLLTTRLSHNATAGLWAVALTGFFNTLPAFYLNWGRYTQLIGQVILPIVIVCWMAALEHPRVSWRLMVLASLASAGLFLTHYLVALFAAAFIGATIVIIILRRPSRITLRHVAIVATGITALTALLILPWVLTLISGYIDNLATSYIDQSNVNSTIVTTLLPISPLYVKAPIVILAFCGIVLALARRHWRIALCAVWTLLLLFLVVPQVVGMPIVGLVSDFTAYIALYITLIPLAAYALGGVFSALRRWTHVLAALSTALLIAISLWGVRWQSTIVDSSYQLLTPADARAMTWIQGHTPADAHFLINMFPAFSDTLFVGDDGGWWIPLLAGRQTTVPPIIYMVERPAAPGYREQINDFAWEMRNHPLPSPEGVQLCLEAGIDYIYIGPHVGTSPANQRIDVQSLRYRPEQFPIVYEQGGVIIFAITPK